MLIRSAALALGGCSDIGRPRPATGLDRKIVTIGELEVAITPTRIDDSGAAFVTAFDTHTGAPDIDVAAHTTLTVDDNPWTQPRWTSDGTSGHHRAGTLTFAAGGPATGTAACP